MSCSGAAHGRTAVLPALLPQTARLISDRDLQLLRRFDKKDPAYQAKLLEEVRLLTCPSACGVVGAWLGSACVHQAELLAAVSIASPLLLLLLLLLAVAVGLLLHRGLPHRAQECDQGRDGAVRAGPGGADAGGCAAFVCWGLHASCAAALGWSWWGQVLPGGHAKGMADCTQLLVCSWAGAGLTCGVLTAPCYLHWQRAGVGGSSPTDPGCATLPSMPPPASQRTRAAPACSTC